jgi:hypothetical protein
MGVPVKKESISIASMKESTGSNFIDTSHIFILGLFAQVATAP